MLMLTDKYVYTYFTTLGSKQKVQFLVLCFTMLLEA